MVVGSGAGRGGGVCQQGKKLVVFMSSCEVVVSVSWEMHGVNVFGEWAH